MTTGPKWLTSRCAVPNAHVSHCRYNEEEEMISLHSLVGRYCVESQSSETVIRSPRYGLISGCFACFFWKPEVNWRFLGKEIPRENERPLSCCSAANDCDMTNRTEHLRSVFLPPFFLSTRGLIWWVEIPLRHNWGNPKIHHHDND